LQIRNYVAKDGNKRYVTEVIANSVEFVERKNTGNASSNADGGQEHTVSKSGMDGFGKAVAFDEEIPF
jgi:single-strand DNA-binding protein